MLKTTRTNVHTLLLQGAALTALVAASQAYALPAGESIAAGSATINTVGADMTIDQSSQKLITNWDSFNIAGGESVTFNQPGSNAIALNRVNAAAGVSTIDGILRSNGQVWVVNPNGTVFGSTARVNVGSLLVSTTGITDDNFLNPTIDGTRSRYTFDQAGNGAIIVREGAEIIAEYPVLSLMDDKTDRTIPPFTDVSPLTLPEISFLTPAEFDALPQVVKDAINAKIAELAAIGTAAFVPYIDGFLNNWTVASGSLDIYTIPASGKPFPASTFTAPVGFDHFIDLDGTSRSGQGEATLESMDFNNLAPGLYGLTATLSGNGRNPANVSDAPLSIPGTSPDSPTDSVTLQILDADTNEVLGSSVVTLNPMQPFDEYHVVINLKDPRNLKLKVAGSTGSSDWQGALLLRTQLRSIESPYVTFMAQAIKQEGGSRVQALNGAINYAAGSTFEIGSVNDQFVDQVTINDPVTTPVIVDGTPDTGIRIQRGAFLWAALDVDGHDDPNGTVTLQAKVRQSAFDDTRDQNGNGEDDHETTFGPAGQVYDSSELVTIENGADIRPAPYFDDGEEGEIIDDGRLIVRAEIIPDPVTPPAGPAINENQVIPPVSDVTFTQVAARDAVSQNFVDRIDPVNDGSSLTSGSLSLLSPAAGGGSATDLAGLAPAAGSSAEDLANLSPSAGGNRGTANASGEMACANEWLDRVDIFQDRPNCDEEERENQI